MFNGRMSPVVPYAIRGAIWNQGYANSFPSVDPMAEMLLGARMARDIPHTGMASQIDIAGAIHYYQKALPGQRLALHALKNQYGKKDLVADGPVFKSYPVQGEQLTVEFDHAEGELIHERVCKNILIGDVW